MLRRCVSPRASGRRAAFGIRKPPRPPRGRRYVRCVVLGVLGRPWRAPTTTPATPTPQKGDTHLRSMSPQRLAVQAGDLGALERQVGHQALAVVGEGQD